MRAREAFHGAQVGGRIVDGRCGSDRDLSPTPESTQLLAYLFFLRPASRIAANLLGVDVRVMDESTCSGARSTSGS